jgi:predicted nucleotidyltransferase
MVNILKLELTNLQQEILRLLFIKVGISLNARAVANALDVSQPAVSKALPLLEKIELIKVEKDKVSGRFSIELNRENNQIIWLKRADNLKQTYESGLVSFLRDSFPGCTIILFGSYSKGEDILTSDIDIAIVGSIEKEINLSKFEKILDRKIILNFYSSFKKIHKSLLENISNGIILTGGIEL